MDKTLLFLLITNIISNSAYSVIPPLLPQALDDKNVDELMVGFILGVYSVSCVLTSLIIGTNFDRLGGVRILSYGLLLMGFCIMLYGMIAYMSSASWVAFYSIILRLMQGTASSMI
mmetsp:Transcript_19222/g.13821  ORF Transcript_19222/g.13821 Transcript_19222/m.13821 type:complete len:116 (+) Transcript_19222:21-368(+)